MTRLDLVRTKSDNVIGGRARASAGSIIVSVTVRRGTCTLEYLRVLRRLASLRRRVLTGAAKLRRVERRARALARHNRPSLRRNLQLGGALTVQVRNAPRVLAVTGSSGCPHPHRHVVTVHQTHVVEVLGGPGSDRELRQRHRRHASTGALHPAGAVSGKAFSDSGVVEVAAGSAPEPPRPARRSCESDGRSRR